MSIDEVMKQFASLTKGINGIKTRDRAREHYMGRLESQRAYLEATKPLNWFWLSKKYQAHEDREFFVSRRQGKWRELQIARVEQRSQYLELRQELASHNPMMAAAFEAGVKISDMGNYLLTIFVSNLSNGGTNELATLAIASQSDAEYFLKVLNHNQPGKTCPVNIAQLSLGMGVYEKLVQPHFSSPLSKKLIYFHGGIKGKDNGFLRALSAWDSLQLS